MRLTILTTVLVSAMSAGLAAAQQTPPTKDVTSRVEQSEAQADPDENVVVRGDGPEIPLPEVEVARRRFEERQEAKCELRAQDQTDPMRPQLETPEEVCAPR